MGVAAVERPSRRREGPGQYPKRVRAGYGNLLVQAQLLESSVHIAHGGHDERGNVDGALGDLGADGDVGDHGGRVVGQDAVLEPGVDVGLVLREGEEVGVGDADHELDAGVSEGLYDVDVAVVDAHVLDGLILDELRHLVRRRQVVGVAPVADANHSAAAVPCDWTAFQFRLLRRKHGKCSDLVSRAPFPRFQMQ
jgi:hypothetical protein